MKTILDNVVSEMQALWVLECYCAQSGGAIDGKVLQDGFFEKVLAASNFKGVICVAHIF